MIRWYHYPRYKRGYIKSISTGCIELLIDDFYSRPLDLSTETLDKWNIFAEAFIRDDKSIPDYVSPDTEEKWEAFIESYHKDVDRIEAVEKLQAERSPKGNNTRQ